MDMTIEVVKAAIAAGDVDTAYCYARELCHVVRARRKANLRRLYRRERDDAMRSLGLVKVRGALGGVYWE